MTFPTPVEDRYFEDYVPGDVHEFGSVIAEEDEKIAFAGRFDPQPFHTDPVAAKQSIFGGIDCQRLAHCEYGYAASG